MPLSTFSRAGSEEGLTYLTKQEQHTLETEAYSQNKSHTQCTATSKNSIVTFDSSSNKLSFKSLNGECFDKNYSGYFYGTSFTGN